MSILIKGIDMPKDIDELRLIINGMSIAIEPTEVIQIPTPHGRLIDEDTFICRMDDSFRMAGLHGADYRKVKRWLKNAQTILEAEE